MNKQPARRTLAEIAEALKSIAELERTFKDRDSVLAEKLTLLVDEVEAWERDYLMALGAIRSGRVPCHSCAHFNDDVFCVPCCDKNGYTIWEPRT
jgi:hypothetical protein